MNSKQLNAAFVVIFISFLAGGIYGYRWYTKEYKPNVKKTRNLQQLLVKVKEDRKAWEEAVKRGQGQANFNVRFNYFTEQGLKGGEIAPHLLNELTPWFNSHGLEFQDLSIQPVQSTGLMQMRPFTLTGIGKFKDVNGAIRWIEEKKRGVVTAFSFEPISEIEATKENEPARKLPPGSLMFSISWHWMEGAPERLHSIVEITETPALKRNPFKIYRPTTATVAKPVVVEPVVVEPSDIGKDIPETATEIVWIPAPDNISLQGIMQIKGKYRVIINDKYLGINMKIQDYTIISIEKSEVILARDNIRCQLRLHTFK